MIVVDVGNTNVHFVWERKGKFLKSRCIETAKADKGMIEKILFPYSGEKVVVCSVVPRVTNVFKSLNQPALIVGEDIKIPIKCFYNEKRVGMDRLVCAFAARRISPRSRIIIDFGTAVTIDFLSDKGDYQGGFILPGIGSTLRVLSSCALLPKKVDFKEARDLIPRDTEESISRGIVEGFSLMINAFVKRYKRILKLSPKTVIILTGGDAAIITPHLDFDYIYEPLLVLKGLVFLENKGFFVDTQ